MTLNCPNCKVEISGEKYGLTDKEMQGIDHCTLNCYQCNSLLLIDNGELKDFHKTIHEECEAWPADGKGTGHLEI